MKTAIKYITLLLLFVITSVDAQSNKIEKEYLQKLAESFIKPTEIKQIASTWLLSRSLGENTLLDSVTLSKRIAALILNDSDRIAFYKRLNHYTSSSKDYTENRLRLYHYITVTLEAKPEKPGKKKQPGPARGQPFQTVALLFFQEDFKDYVSYIISYGRDESLANPCNISESDSIYTLTEVLPQFPGGDEAMLKILASYIVYPGMERDNDIQGKVIVRFVVCENGKVSQPTILRGVSPGLDREAVRAVKILPDFTPGTKDGFPVKVYYNLPIVFKLQ